MDQQDNLLLERIMLAEKKGADTPGILYW